MFLSRGPAWVGFREFCGNAFCATIRGETPCSCPADCGTAPAAEPACSDGLDDDCDGLIDCADADCAGQSLCAGAGSVPAETPLLVNPGVGGGLDLTWGDSCSASDTDYAVYEGLLGVPGSHTPETCSTGGATAWTVATPANGNRYYLVVPRNAVYEGSHGIENGGAERSQGAFSCVPRVVACP